MARREGSELDPEAPAQGATVASTNSPPAGGVVRPQSQASDVAPSPTATQPPIESVTREIEVGGERVSGAFPNAWVIEEGSGERSQASVLEPPAPERMPRVLLRLSREVGIDMQDDEIVHAFVEAMRDLFPGRRFAVRLLASDADDRDERRVALFYASGRLRKGMRDPLLLGTSAAETHGLDAAELERCGVRLTPTYVPFFEPEAEGFDVPLTDGSKLLGILSVEVPSGFTMPAWDAPILVPLALEMASKLKSARLLRESNYLRDYLAQVIERANAPIVVLRPDRHAARVNVVEKVNIAFLNATQGQREDWVGSDFVALLPDTERGRALAALDAARAGVATSNVELRVPRHASGFARIVFNTASIASSDGEIAGIVAIGRDMTEVRDLEEQIIQAEKLATLGQLAAGVVHELNNPLTSISVYSEYLLTKGKRAGADPGDLEKLGRIAEGAARMLRFTRDLVTYARPSSEEPSNVSMAEVVDQALVFCEHVISEAQVVVERAYGEGLPPLWAVRGQLHQVFINLITNACHAIAATGVSQASKVRVGATLTIRVERDGEAGVVVEVVDDGPGIAQEHVEHIFEPFFSTKGEGKGTGLGLSIVRNIVQQHGGTISVTSVIGAPEHGTTFTLRFPRRPYSMLTPPRE